MDQEPGHEATEAEAVRLYLHALEVPPLSWSEVEARARSLPERPPHSSWPVWPTSIAGLVVAAGLLVLIGGRALAPVRHVPNAAPHASATATNAAAMTAYTPLSQVATARPVRWRGQTYRVEAVPVAPSELAGRLTGRPPARAAWQMPARLPRNPRPLDVLALYALRGQSPSAALAVLGRFGSGPLMLWRAQPLGAAAKPGLHGSHP